MESLLLQKQVRDNAKDLQEYCKDLLEWGNEMKQKDESLKRSSKNQSEVIFINYTAPDFCEPYRSIISTVLMILFRTF